MSSSTRSASTWAATAGSCGRGRRRSRRPTTPIPRIRAREVPDSLRQERISGGEHWSIVGEDDLVTHVRVFLESVKSRKPVVEDARFGHRAAATAHLMNRSLREGRVFEWDRAADRAKA